MNIVTGYKGAAHVTAQQDRFINQSAFGTATYFLPIGNRMTCTIDSATQVTIADGGVSLQGCVAVIETGQTEVLQIASGATGMERMDYICAVYTKNASGVEAVALEVKTGTPVAGTPSAPSYTSGSIEAGDTLVEVPIFQVNVDGLAISSVEKVVPDVSTAAQLLSSLNVLTTTVGTKAAVYSFTSGDDVDTVRNSIPLRNVFLFNGTGAFSQEVLQTETQLSSFGFGFKSSTITMVFVAIAAGNLYYATYNSDGTGTVYNPVNLTTNV